MEKMWIDENDSRATATTTLSNKLSKVAVAIHPRKLNSLRKYTLDRNALERADMIAKMD